MSVRRVFMDIQAVLHKLQHTYAERIVWKGEVRYRQEVVLELETFLKNNPYAEDMYEVEPLLAFHDRPA